MTQYTITAWKDTVVVFIAENNARAWVFEDIHAKVYNDKRRKSGIFTV